MTNYEYICKEYPEVVRECIERRYCNLKVTSNGIIKSCADGTICDGSNCIFSSKSSYAPYSDGQSLDGCHQRIAHWLNRTASAINDDDSDMRNKDGDITW